MDVIVKLQHKLYSTMKFNILLLTLVSFVLLSGLVSAEANVFVDQIAGNTTSVAPGASPQISFVIKNAFNLDLEDVKIVLPSLSAGSWDPSVKIGSTTAQISNGQVTIPGKIVAGTAANPTASPLITLTLKVLPQAAPGASVGTLDIQGKYSISGSSATIQGVRVSVTVTSSPSLSFVQIGSTLSSTVSSTKIALNNTGNIALTNIVFNLSGDLNFTLSSGAIPLLAAGTISSPIDINADLSRLHFGENTATVTARSAEGTSATNTYSIRKSFCSSGVRSTNLTLRNVDIVEYNEKADTWKPGDGITLEAEVKSNVPDSDDIVIEMALFDEQGNDVTGDLTFVSKDKEQVDVGNIGDDSETATFEFRVPADMDKGNYRLAVKAFSDSEGEDKVCNDISGDFGSNLYFKPIKIENEKEEGRYIVFDNARTTPNQATCGDSVALTTDVFNIGTKKQERTRVNLVNRELGINQQFEIKKTMNVGDKQKGVSFIFTLPRNAADKTYNLELTADYNYDKGQDEYDISSETSTDVPLKVFGCTPSVADASSKKADITANVESEVAAGKDVVIKSTLRNVGNATTKYALVIKNVDSWATIKEVSFDKIIELAPGQSKDITFILVAKDTAKGVQSLLIEAVSDRATDSKTFTVTFPETKAAGLNLGGNTLLWIIGAVNVVLLIIIVLVAIKLSRR